jgi:proteasome lid subunit RPN8/RPN11
MLKISAAAVAEIRAHAVEGYPFEICGVLIGKSEDGTRAVVHAWRVPNTWETQPEERAEMIRALEAAGGPASEERWLEADTRRRFLVSPTDIHAAMKRARAEGLDLVGVYHTHPNHPAVPSDFDRSAAWPEWSYVILSVRDGSVAEFRSWFVADDGPFQEETVEQLPADE